MSVEQDAYLLVAGLRRTTFRERIVVGRGRACDFILHGDEEASRRHAQFTVTSAGVLVEDLGSTNGTFVGGEPVVGQQLLAGDDVVRVGSSVVRICPANGNADGDDPDADITVADGVPRVGHEATRPADIFDVLERVAFKAMSRGDRDEAERVTGAHLEKLLQEAKSGNESADHIDRAIRIACELSQGAPSARWANFLIELHTALRKPMTAKVVDALQPAFATRSDPDFDALQRYCQQLEIWRGRLSDDQKRVSDRVQGLLAVPRA